VDPVPCLLHWPVITRKKGKKLNENSPKSVGEGGGNINEKKQEKTARGRNYLNEMAVKHEESKSRVVLSSAPADSLENFN
jgi:hypothetical protein